MNIKLLFVLFLMLLVALFSVQNAEMITVRFLYWQFAMSQALVIILAAVCGALVGAITVAVTARRKPAPPVEPPPPAEQP